MGIRQRPPEICPMSDKMLSVVEYEDLTYQAQKYIILYYFKADNLHGTDRLILQVNLLCSPTPFIVCLTEIVTWSDILYVLSKNKNHLIDSPELSELISTYFSVSLQNQENVKEQ